MREKNLIKKSMFKQSECRVIYTFEENKKESTTGYISPKWQLSTRIFSTKELIPDSEKEICTCELEIPMLEVGENFYIEELYRTVIVMERVRSSNDKVCYYLQPKIIEDEISKLSKEKADQLQMEYLSKVEINKRVKELTLENKRLREFKDRVKSSFWYKFMKKYTVREITIPY